MFDFSYEEQLHCQVMRSCLNAIQKEKPLILKGGTALMFAYGLKRFSEDLDFDISANYTGKGTIKLDRVLKNALPLGIKLQELVLRKDTPSLTRYILHYQKNEIYQRLKIEISYRSPVSDFDVFEKDGNQFLSIKKIAEFKIKTVLDNSPEARTKARDLFDSVFIVKNYPQKINSELLRKLKQIDIDNLLSRYEQAFNNDEIMKKHKITADEVILELLDTIKNIKKRSLSL